MNELSFLNFLKEISLNDEVINKILLYEKELNKSYKEIYNEILKHKDFDSILKQLKDEDGFKILTVYLLVSYDDLKLYKEKKITKKIYIDTFKCYSRFIKETYLSTNKFKFDRYFWVYRHTELKLFRIGELEYEIDDENKEISIHIPSDANIKLNLVKKSLYQSYDFFNNYFKSVSSYKYSLSSWILSKNLKELLDKDSNILKFQSLFKIDKEYIDNSNLYFFIFNTKDNNINNLKENTTLQRNLKKFLLEGKNFYSAKGELNIDLKGGKLWKRIYVF